MVFTLISNNFSKARIRKEFSSEGYSCSNGLGLSWGFLTFCGIDGLEKTIGLTSFADPSAKKKSQFCKVCIDKRLNHSVTQSVQ